MLADFEFKFNQHDDTIRRAESNARLLTALSPRRPTQDADQPQRRLSTWLRRLAGTAYTAA
jgi:hypothetical protein